MKFSQLSQLANREKHPYVDLIIISKIKSGGGFVVV